MGKESRLFKIVRHLLDKTLGIWIIKVSPRPSTSYAKEHFKGKNVIAAEIGVYKGKNAQSILKELNIKKFYAIDPYITYLDATTAGKIDHQNLMYDAKRLAESRLNINKNVVWINEYSHKAKARINEPLDFCYIDGNHEYDSVLEDLNDYYPLVRKGGILAGHDIERESISMALKEFLKNKNCLFLVRVPDWIIIK